MGRTPKKDKAKNKSHESGKDKNHDRQGDHEDRD